GLIDRSFARGTNVEFTPITLPVKGCRRASGGENTWASQPAPVLPPATRMRRESAMARNPSFCFAALLLAAGLTARAEAPADPLEKSPSRYAKSDGVKVHYKSLGKGETALVFVHGWTADMTSWRYQVPAFDGKVRMILIDLPGHGKSEKPEVEYTMDRFARAIDDVLTDAGVTKGVLAGHSMGTPVVRQYYRRYPKKVIGLIAVDGRLQRFNVPPE